MTLKVSFPLWERGLKLEGDKMTREDIKVVPLVGTWIETACCIYHTSLSESFPLWERGLKHVYRPNPNAKEVVVPLVGTWIETRHCAGIVCTERVVPLVGTWIETLVCLSTASMTSSFPLWERGLKLHRKGLQGF